MVDITFCTSSKPSFSLLAPSSAHLHSHYASNTLGFTCFPLRTASIFGVALFLEGEDKSVRLLTAISYPSGVDIVVHIFLVDILESGRVRSEDSMLPLSARSHGGSRKAAVFSYIVQVIALGLPVRISYNEI